jgi:iron complex transport system ATP-binding protein
MGHEAGRLTPPAMDIVAKGVTVHYPGQPNAALEDVDLEMAAGRLLAVVGPNGSGKSSLLRALLGMVPLRRGGVRIADRPLAEWPRRELAREIGVVSQYEPTSFPIRVRDVVEMGRYPHLGQWAPLGARDRDCVQAAMAACQVLSFADRRVETLSGGEHQRVRIARALAQEPRALLLDEPTASLDIRHEMEIFQLLRREADRGLTVCVITHHLDMASRFADEVALLGCGRRAAYGPPDEVLRPAVLEEVYGWPIAVRTDEVTGRLRVIPLP